MATGNPAANVRAKIFLAKIGGIVYKVGMARFLAVVSDRLAPSGIWRFPVNTALAIAVSGKRASYFATPGRF